MLKTDKVDLDILWWLAGQEKLLSDAEEFLTHAGEGGLALKLNKLQQDVALEIADHWEDPLLGQTDKPSENLEGLGRFLSDVDPENLHITPELQGGYEIVSYARLDLFDELQKTLLSHGFIRSQEFGYIAQGLKSFSAADIAKAPGGPEPTI